MSPADPGDPGLPDDRARLLAANEELTRRLAVVLAADADRVATIDAAREDVETAIEEREWLRALVAERDAELAAAKATLAERDATLAVLEEQHAARLSELEGAFAEERAWLADVVSDKEKFGADRQAEVEELRAEIEQRRAEFERLNDELERHRRDLGFRLRRQLGRVDGGP
jgi:chromosome segregation ATPase